MPNVPFMCITFDNKTEKIVANRHHFRVARAQLQKNMISVWNKVTGL